MSSYVFGGLVILCIVAYINCETFSVVNGTTSIKFCSEASISSTMEKLILDGTYAVKESSSSKSCRCTLEFRNTVPNALGIALDMSGTLGNKQCYTRFDVLRPDGNTLHNLYCNWTRIDLDRKEYESGLKFYLHIHIPEEPYPIVPEWYRIYVYLNSPTNATVHCSQPTSAVYPTVVSPTSWSTKTPSVSSPTTAHANMGNDQTSIIVGVVIGIGLLMLVLISCLLCYIARRSKNKESNTQQTSGSPFDQQENQDNNFIQRTLSRARNKITNARPLPRIPKSLRKFTVRRKVIERQIESEYYASISSDYSNPNNNIHNNNFKSEITKGHMTQQLSVESSASYIHPSEIKSLERQTDAGIEDYGGNHSNVGKAVTAAMENNNDYLNATLRSNNNTSIAGDGLGPSDGNHPVKQNKANANTNIAACNLATQVSEPYYIEMENNGDPKLLKQDSKGYVDTSIFVGSDNDSADSRVNEMESKDCVDTSSYVESENGAISSRLVKMDSQDYVDTSSYVKPENDAFCSGLVKMDSQDYVDTNSDVEPDNASSCSKLEQMEPADYVDTSLYVKADNVLDVVNASLNASANNEGHSNPYSNIINDSEYANVGKGLVNCNNSEHSTTNSTVDNDDIGESSSEFTNNQPPADDTYLSMHPVSNKSSYPRNDEMMNADKNTDRVEKEPLKATDSAGYMKMADLPKNQDRLGLKKKDSIFPNLISFRAHGVGEHKAKGSDLK